MAQYRLAVARGHAPSQAAAARDVLRSARVSRRGEMPDEIPDERRSYVGDAFEAVLALPEKYKTCVYLHYYEGYKTAEIATMTDTPASTVRSRFSRARRRIS